MDLLLAATCASKRAVQLGGSMLHPGLCAPTCWSALNALLMTVAQTEVAHLQGLWEVHAGHAVQGRGEGAAAAPTICAVLSGRW